LNSAFELLSQLLNQVLGGGGGHVQYENIYKEFFSSNQYSFSNSGKLLAGIRFSLENIYLIRFFFKTAESLS
jgi:hypothetical protein